mmetsp:Transcript_27754/g.68263  ORF Transcript_27754/g.68263 Transcript_27754/m.68263 type:complete len:209 (-) Transcript_27754:141-767(-)
MLEPLVLEELRGKVHVRGDYAQGTLLAPTLVRQQVTHAVDIVPRLGHGDGQVAPAKAEGVVHHNKVRVLVADLAQHVVSDDADVDVAGVKLADDVSGALEPHLHAGDVGNLGSVLPRVDLAHLELARVEELHGLLSHAALARDAHTHRIAGLDSLAERLSRRLLLPNARDGGERALRLDNNCILSTRRNPLTREAFPSRQIRRGQSRS